MLDFDSKGNDVSMSVQHPDRRLKRSTKIIFVNSRIEGGWISQGSWWKISGGEKYLEISEDICRYLEIFVGGK